MDVQGGVIHAKEDYNGNWRPVEVYWTTGLASTGVLWKMMVEKSPLSRCSTAASKRRNSSAH